MPNISILCVLFDDDDVSCYNYTVPVTDECIWSTGDMMLTGKNQSTAKFLSSII